MAAMRLLLVLCLVSVFVYPVVGEEYPVILRGRVTMPDGTPPSFTVALERVCSDTSGSAPGPLANKKGEYIWTMMVDPMRTRACVIQATHPGYSSSSIDISAFNGYINTNLDMPPIIIMSRALDPYAIIISESDVPLHAIPKWKSAMKLLEAGKNSEARQQFQAAVEAAPKFAMGWHAIGVLSEYISMPKDAREAYQHAIEADPKQLPPYMTLVRLCIKGKDWECAANTADALLKVDKKHMYPDIHLHAAVALYGLKRLDEAESQAREALRLDAYHVRPRSEYVLGRILEAKGDIEGAREHIQKYLELDKRAPDAEAIRARLPNLGKAPQEGMKELDLEYL